MSLPTGTIITRRTPIASDKAFNEGIVVGSDKNGVSFQSKNEFSEVRRLTAEEVRAEYDFVLPDGAEFSAPSYSETEPSPEEVFRAEAAKNPSAADPGRAKLRANAAAAEAETGKPQPEPTKEEVAATS